MSSQPTFQDIYTTAARPQLEALIGRSLTKAEVERLHRLAHERTMDRPATILNNYRNLEIPTTLSKLGAWMLQRNPMPPIVTGHGTLFKQHGEHSSVIGAMVQMLMDRRKVEKNAMFDMMRAGRSPDDPEVKAKDQAQKILKLLANSYYGAMGEKGFIFYDPNNGPATTYTGQLIIASTLYSFETFLTNNCWLENADELTRHVALCLQHAAEVESPEDEWGAHPLADAITEDAVIDALIEACAPTWDARPVAEKLVRGRSKHDLWSLALRGDPHAFMQFPRALDLLDIAISGEIREADPGKLAKHHPDGKVAIEALWEGMRRWVMVPHVPGDLPRRITRIRRKRVILTDTDSTFLNLGPWMRFLGSQYDMESMTEDERLTGMNIIVYLLRLFNDHQMEELTKALGVPPEKRRLINFKSEFVIGRMVLTDGKKNYVALLRFQEGARIIGDKVELKGLAVKKTTVARSTREFFEESIETRILRSEVIDRVNVVRDIVSLEDRIRGTLETGGTEYSTPGVLGRLSMYADRYAMPVVRGMLAYNATAPDSPIREGDRINLLRLRVGTDAGLLAEELNQWPEGSEEARALEAIAAEFFGPSAPEELLKNGLNWLALPKELTEIPAWARRLIDVDSVLQANISPALPILTSIGIRPIRLSSQADSYSNTIPF